MQDDSRTLEHLQKAAQGAEGQLQAIGYANQFASQQSNQLLQIRALLTAQQTAQAAKMAAELDEKARTNARIKQQTTWEFKPSPPVDWGHPLNMEQPKILQTYNLKRNKIQRNKI
ncbi:hypothetical protein [Bartonella sp. AR 15-3]|uniref:hypothetical protein n=1 Tax=Bartonella sp. AR 15-3 TaxID=545617 RepID=UPI0001F4BA14|nr:hypothetical protein [Bartonella sp. AR 15-3]OPB32199.1 P-type conjugative transfer protein TrbJ [Bartonella sp. AR 15-3]CBI79848.1 hypothetical protein BAR15_180081 [Bartonella sp. AR 15-3]